MSEVFAGTVTSHTDVRRGPQFLDPQAPFQLTPGDKLGITGFTVHPKAPVKWRRRYRVLIDDMVYWVPAAAIAVSLPDIRRMPFVIHDALGSDPAGALLKALGLQMNDGPMDESRAVALARYLWTQDFMLRGEQSVLGLEQLLPMLRELDRYGVHMSSEFGGTWTVSEVRSVYNVVVRTAEATFNVMQRIANPPSAFVAFQALYGPMRINRSPVANVNPFGTSTWYARNVDGFEVTLGDQVFFDGEQRTFALEQAGIPMFYNTEQLIAHHIAHHLNDRYLVETLDSDTLYEPDDYYLANFQFANDAGIDTGYGFAARSSDKSCETVTDAFANFNMGTLSDDNAGDARRQQITIMLKGIIRYRLQRLGFDNLYAQILSRGGALLMKKMQTALDLMDMDSVENIRLREILAA